MGAGCCARPLDEDDRRGDAAGGFARRCRRWLNSRRRGYMLAPAGAVKYSFAHSSRALLDRQLWRRNPHHEARAAPGRRVDFELRAQGQTLRCTTASPRPSPRYLRALDCESCANGSAACLISAALIPSPVSATSSTRAESTPRVRAVLIRTVTLPRSVNLIAFSTRLERIERSGRREV